MVHAVFTSNSLPERYFGSTLTFNGGVWTLALKEGTTMQFGNESLLDSITDRNGNTIQLQRNANLNLTQITSPNGRWIALNYDSKGCV